MTAEMKHYVSLIRFRRTLRRLKIRVFAIKADKLAEFTEKYKKPNA